MLYTFSRGISVSVIIFLNNIISMNFAYANTVNIDGTINYNDINNIHIPLYSNNDVVINNLFEILSIVSNNK